MKTLKHRSLIFYDEVLSDPFEIGSIDGEVFRPELLKKFAIKNLPKDEILYFILKFFRLQAFTKL